MFEITYKPRTKSKFSNSDMIFDILFDHDTTTEIATFAKNQHIFYDYVRVRKSSIYKDVRVAVKKILSIRMGWDAHPHEIRNLFIVLSKSLCQEDVYTIEHIICKIINSFYSDVQMNTVNLIVTHDSPENDEHIQHCVDIASKVLGGRMLAMLPANVATPAYVAHYIQHMFKDEKRTTTKILNRDRLHKDKYNLLLGIGDSAKNPPKMVIIERRGSKNGKTIAIVGKGITFDSGGLAIKSYQHMVDMKFDKIGAVYGSVGSRTYFIYRMFSISRECCV
jgi:leucyl aminopeptidase